MKKMLMMTTMLSLFVLGSCAHNHGAHDHGQKDKMACCQGKEKKDCCKKENACKDGTCSEKKDA
ncbi:MAG: hypothetical protein CME62_08420 [Halobacteriovoraceae bacterium]|nr:hypothetical protein [Halobacteriovoraceae bacterium]|tara:strand:+ start:2614 stop:2805 length:192 start_codon:yes stop_codon:yes gene_type:complete